MFTTVAASLAQQRSVAYSLVSADIANVTALPFADLTAGLNPSVDSLANDPNIHVGGYLHPDAHGSDPRHHERQRVGEPARPAHHDDHGRHPLQGGDLPGGDLLRCCHRDGDRDLAFRAGGDRSGRGPDRGCGAMTPRRRQAETACPTPRMAARSRQ